MLAGGSYINELQMLSLLLLAKVEVEYTEEQIERKMSCLVLTYEENENGQLDRRRKTVRFGLCVGQLSSISRIMIQRT